ncbi:hypothetical protein AAVH_13525 [Aphelenchoides avenae]|nr:hypothetical protein AAVH_35797 [Aphelenchus avenae]KAH7719058.1 hypothetical protein AAVH_13523 [Aphelenchus avenae]KAH7719060.1 hypothetical protein AAVH_13525 [Aphelenchus avenae]
MLTIEPEFDEEDEPYEVNLHIETDMRKAVSYLSSCYVPSFVVLELDGRTLYECPIHRAIITASGRICTLKLQECHFDSDGENTLSETLRVCNFQRVSLLYSPIPAWQITDQLLESLRLRGCNEFYDESYNGNADEKKPVTEEGILSLCFTRNDEFPTPKWRFLRIQCVNRTPAFFKKLAQASKNSQLTCDVQLWLYDLRFDVSNLDVGVKPSRSLAAENPPEYRYNIADHGNGIRLVIHFESYGGETCRVTVRHGKKDREERRCNFFEPEPDEEQQARTP